MSRRQRLQQTTGPVPHGLLRVNPRAWTVQRAADRPLSSVTVGRPLSSVTADRPQPAWASLPLVGARTFDSGNVLLTYRQA
jgi:hypothetical protein